MLNDDLRNAGMFGQPVAVRRRRAGRRPSGRARRSHAVTTALSAYDQRVGRAVASLACRAPRRPPRW